jgi:hypothetical protein
MAKITIWQQPPGTKKPIEVWSEFQADIDGEPGLNYHPAVVMKKYKKHGIEVLEVAVSIRFGQPAPVYRFTFDGKNWVSDTESPIVHIPVNSHTHSGVIRTHRRKKRLVKTILH